MTYSSCYTVPSDGQNAFQLIVGSLRRSRHDVLLLPDLGFDFRHFDGVTAGGRLKDFFQLTEDFVNFVFDQPLEFLPLSTWREIEK